jgi:hypothetical protein
MSAASNQTAAALKIAETAPEVRAPGNVIEALAAVAADLPAIGKDGKADPKQGGYSYRGIEQITREAQRLFARYRVVFVPRVVHHEIRQITVNDKPWTDTVELVEYDVYGPGGVEDRITVGPILAIGRDNSDKGANKCLTQSFKYALLQTLCISDAKDDSDGWTHEADPPAFVWTTGAVKARLVELLDGDKAAAKEAWTLGGGENEPPSPELADRLAAEWRANQPAPGEAEPEAVPE